MNAQRIPHFRSQRRSESPSWTPVIAIAILAAFDLYIIGYIVWQLWKLAR